MGISEGLSNRKSATWLEASQKSDGVGEMDGVPATEGFADLGEAGVLFQVQCRTTGAGGFFTTKPPGKPLQVRYRELNNY